MRRRLIILANSRKAGNRCIAGIDFKSGRWIRPVYSDGTSGIPWNIRNINGQEPQLLDIISIPLKEDGPNREIQPENRQLLDGQWIKVGKADIEQLEPYKKTEGIILYNTEDRIHVNRLIRPVRESICLIEAYVTFFTGSYIHGGKRVNAMFEFSGNGYTIPVTDYDFWLNFPPYHVGTAKCLLTISMGLPFERDDCCYKFVVGVILLDELQLQEQG